MKQSKQIKEMNASLIKAINLYCLIAQSFFSYAKHILRATILRTIAIILRIWVLLLRHRGSLTPLYITGMTEAPSRLANEISKKPIQQAATNSLKTRIYAKNKWRISE